MVHQRVDIERWKGLFSLEKLRREAREYVESRRRESPGEYKNASDVERHVKLMSPGGEIITSPQHLAVVEQIRAECLSNTNLPLAPTDVFVFAKGEPSNRAVTKVGGLPFWPKGKRWPTGKSGQPMSFVAQFCFTDSRDLFDSLPGDVLLIFADGIYLKDWKDGDPGALQFEWVNCSETDLVEAKDIPQARWDLFPVYGEIHRTKDYVTDNVSELALDAYKQPYLIDVTQGTKIGGIPRWIQGPENDVGKFLCALGSVGPVFQISEDRPRPYPFTNLKGPLVRGGRKTFRSAEGEKIQTDRLLKWGDAGSLFVFLDDAGRIRWTIQFY